MQPLFCEAIEITAGTKNLLEFTPLREPGLCTWHVWNDAGPSLDELFRSYADAMHYKLVEAQYSDCDPSITGAFRTRFFSKQHFGERDYCSCADWVRSALYTHADFPWEGVRWTIEPLFRNDDAGPRVLRIHLMHPAYVPQMDIFAEAA